MGRPKALLRYRGRTFLDCVLDAIASSPLELGVVVLGHDRERILDSVDVRRWVYNPDYEQGMTTSFQAGIRELPASAEGAMIFLVDHPLVAHNTLEALLAGFAPGKIVLPVHAGRRGHPVLFSRAVNEEILELPSDRGVNTVVWRVPERVIEVGVADRSILVDVDTPDQYEALEERAGDEPPQK